MNRRALAIATAAGVVLQVAMVVAGHLEPAIKAAFAIGGMGFSFLAGYIFARLARASWGAALGGGAAAGAVCAAVGIAVSVALKDAPVLLLALGTVSSAVTGLIGGAVGRMLPAGRAKPA